MYKFYPNCKIVFGSNRAIIYDLFRSRYKIIPKELAELLLDNEEKDIILNNTLTEINREIFIDFINQLKEDDFVFVYDNNKLNLFTDFNFDFEKPEHIMTIIVDFSKYNISKFEDLIQIIESNNIKYLCLIINLKLKKELLLMISEKTKNTQIEYIEIINNEIFNVNNTVVNIINDNTRFSKITSLKTIYRKNTKEPLWCSVNKISNLKIKNTFSVNHILFSESLNFNTHFNRKIFVDSFGEIVKFLNILILFFLPHLIYSQNIDLKPYKQFYIADSLYNSQNYCDCIKYYENGLKKNKLMNLMYYKLAISYKNCNKFDQSFKTIRYAVKNKLRYLDTSYILKDKDLTECLSHISRKKYNKIYNKLIYNSFQYSKIYNTKLKFPKESTLLEELKTQDQKYRGGTSKSDSVWNLQKKIDIQNQFKLNKMLKYMNWPGLLEVGVEGSKSAFLIIQHSDNDIKFQKKCLKRMYNELKTKNIHLADFAYLFDRISLKNNKYQLFGSQIEYKTVNGREIAIASKLLDSLNVNIYRNYFELPPLNEYIEYFNKKK